MWLNSWYGCLRRPLMSSIALMLDNHPTEMHFGFSSAMRSGSAARLFLRPQARDCTVNIMRRVWKAQKVQGGAAAHLAAPVSPHMSRLCLGVCRAAPRAGHQ